MQNLIERCLQLYMNKDEVVKILLTRARINPEYTTLVWQKLEEENANFVNMTCYQSYVSAIVSFVFVFVCNFILCFLPYVDNFASIGGFIPEFLLGSVLLLSRKLELPKVPIKGTLVYYGVKSYIKLKLKQNMDRPFLLFVDWLVVLWQFFMGSISIVIAHGAHMLTVSLIQAGTAKMEKPLVRMGGSPYYDKTNVKRGLWTPEEDTKILAYLKLESWCIISN
ncbi:hypothetical protein S245_063900, partial [Arachis hypogaea]